MTRSPNSISVRALAAPSTVTCELHHAFEHFHWTGFYRVVGTDLLAVGPYQGTSGRRA